MSRTYFSREELTERAAAAFSRGFAVRLQDVDAAGIVFFARIFEYFHDGLMAYLDEQGVSMARWLEQGRLLAPIKHAEADFLTPLRYGDRLDCEIVRARVEATEALVGLRLVHTASRAPAAVGQTLHVCVDTATGARAPLPPPIADALRRVEAERAG